MNTVHVAGATNSGEPLPRLDLYLVNGKGHKHIKAAIKQIPETDRDLKVQALAHVPSGKSVANAA